MEIENKLQNIQNLFEHNNNQVDKKFIYNFIKRVFDLLFALFLTPFTLIIVLIFGILIKIDSKGPIFYKQKRCGLNGKLFNIYKLRSMFIDAEASGGAQWAVKNDPRITRVGKIIRKTRIDELPQLLNIFTGTITFVGPRPERPELILQFSETIPNFVERNKVKPGLTGLAQINGGYEMSPQEKLEWDLKYIKSRSLILDIKILLKTVIIVLTGHGAY